MNSILQVTIGERKLELFEEQGLYEVQIIGRKGEWTEVLGTDKPVAFTMFHQKVSEILAFEVVERLIANGTPN
mgnify:FL=1